MVKGANCAYPLRMHGTVLVCDDDHAFRHVLARALTRRGLHVLAAADADQALELCTGCSPDFAILDLHMPKTNGFRLLGELKRRKRELRVVLLTGAYSDSVHSAAMRLGAHACRAKPADADDILALLA
jgi:two-component system response regulator RegA